MASTVTVWVKLRKTFTAPDLDGAEALGYNYIEQVKALGPFDEIDTDLDVTSIDLTNWEPVERK